MADTQPQQNNTDNELISENGHSGRILCASTVAADGRSTASPNTRNNSVLTRFLAPPRSMFRDFTCRFGDTCQEDRNNYPGNLAGTPQRAMASYEGDYQRNVAPGQTVFMETALNLLPTPGNPVIAQADQPWWATIAQWNEPPVFTQGATRWRSPPVAVELVWEAGIEYLAFVGRKEPAARNDQGITAFHHRIPVQRVQHGFRMEFTDGKGGLGKAKCWLSGRLEVDYEGLLGYFNFGNPAASRGYYRSVNSKEVRTIRFENFTEGLMA